MRFFEKIKVNVIYGKLRQIRLFGLPILEYSSYPDKKGFSLSFPLFRSTQFCNSRVFYLKVNRSDDYSIICLQHWLNIIAALKADYVIVCDNQEAELKIMRKVVFHTPNVKFIKSNYCSFLKNLVKRVASKPWVKAAHAHLTTFYHAKQNGLTSFWNIDADDTTFLLPPSRVAELLVRAEEIAEEKDFSMFSLDMWKSRTFSQHWSFGITYTRNTVDFFEIFNSNPDNSWHKLYEDTVEFPNLDWFINYLVDYKQLLSVGTFYAEGCHFIHWSDFLFNIIGGSLCYWENGKLILPIAKDALRLSKLGTFEISNECIKVDIGIQYNECMNFYLKEFCILRFYPKQAQEFYRFADFGW